MRPGSSGEALTPGRLLHGARLHPGTERRADAGGAGRLPGRSRPLHRLLPPGGRGLCPGALLAAGPGCGRCASQLAGSPYETTYDLAREVTADAATPYEAARRLELYLRATYEYDQDPGEHAYPLPAFLFEDRRGYCQQFSGAMALMLRMIGIPSRVASGFSPGGRDPETRGLPGRGRRRPLLGRGLFHRDRLGPVRADPGRRPRRGPARRQRGRRHGGRADLLHGRDRPGPEPGCERRRPRRGQAAAASRSPSQGGGDSGPGAAADRRGSGGGDRDRAGRGLRASVAAPPPARPRGAQQGELAELAGALAGSTGRCRRAPPCSRPSGGSRDLAGPEASGYAAALRGATLPAPLGVAARDRGAARPSPGAACGERLAASARGACRDLARRPCRPPPLNRTGCPINVLEFG